MTVEPGKTYAIEAADVNGDLTANAIGSLNVYGPDTVSAPAEANADCTAANGPRPPAVEVASDGIRCVVRTALPTAGMQQNKRALFVKVTRMDPATGGGSQFKIRAREATAYGRWIINGFDYHVEVENTTGDAMCVEVSRYPASGLASISSLRPRTRGDAQHLVTLPRARRRFEAPPRAISRRPCRDFRRRPRPSAD